MKSRIICIGNRLVENDRAGIDVYDRLVLKKIPEHIELIEGGIAGLNLLCFLENVVNVVFVDAVCGFTAPGEIVVLNKEQIKNEIRDKHYGHYSGIAYLLTVLPKVCEGDLPRKIFLIGLEGRCSPQTINRAADMAILIAETRGRSHQS